MREREITVKRMKNKSDKFQGFQEREHSSHSSIVEREKTNLSFNALLNEMVDE